MPKLPVISGKDLIKVLETRGYMTVRQKGSHVRLRHDDSKTYKPLTIPLHPEIKPGLLSRILKDANLDPKYL